MRKAVVLVTGLVILAIVNFGIYHRERLLTRGEVVLLELSPVDPRSLMQGDYMRLNFAAADQAFAGLKPGSRADGHLIVRLGDRRVGRFRRLADARPLAPGEMILRYRVRNGRPQFGTNAFFFQEGRADAFQGARYGEFRVGADGEMILTGLRDAALKPLG